ncbi:RDD family protein [Gallaecimonas pentaromativorans]|uniref:RDD family protein n=1 Tax=Gallaecimonas pentaromativorans TaxID=584787 RepID=UPI00067EC6B3|nr:RDD family protein [Gallaecimonas pentaromativorans]MED5524715.1 RDD family protein [Pseudomonadota bacterium]
MKGHFPRASFGRRLAALCYDYLLACAVFMLAHFLGFALLALAIQLFPALLDGYPDQASFMRDQPLYSLYLMLCVLGFFLWFWTHGGQTLGMRAWRLKLQSQQGGPVSLKQALLRALCALLGAGTLGVLLGSRRLALQDRASHTEVVLVDTPKP